MRNKTSICKVFMTDAGTQNKITLESAVSIWPHCLLQLFARVLQSCSCKSTSWVSPDLERFKGVSFFFSFNMLTLKEKAPFS